MSVATLLWIALRSRRRSLPSAVRLAAAIAAPYALVMLLMTGGFRSLAPIRWTLLVPLRMGRAGDNLHLLDLEQLRELVALALAVPAVAFVRAALPAARRFRLASLV